MQNLLTLCVPRCYLLTISKYFSKHFPSSLYHALLVFLKFCILPVYFIHGYNAGYCFATFSILLYCLCFFKFPLQNLLIFRERSSTTLFVFSSILATHFARRCKDIIFQHLSYLSIVYPSEISLSFTKSDAILFRLLRSSILSVHFPSFISLHLVFHCIFDMHCCCILFLWIKLIFFQHFS